MSFREFACFGEEVHFTDELIDNFIKHYKPCLREPEADGCNKQTQEVCVISECDYGHTHLDEDGNSHKMYCCISKPSGCEG